MRQRDKTPRQLERIAREQGPLAAAVAWSGGTRVTARLRADFVGRGCGSPTPVVGTSGHAPCGSFITNLREERREHLCPHCKV